MRVMVTGGGGFIGSHLVRRLIDEGHQVCVVDRASMHWEQGTDKVRVVRGDFGDVNLLQDCLDGVDVVFHLAWTTIPKTSNEDPVADVSSNVIGTIRLLQECSDSGVKRVIFNSSGGVIYGPTCAVPIAEHSGTNPVCSYGITKLAVEKYLELFRCIRNLDYVILRISNAYGPGQNPQGGVGLIAAALASALKQRTLDVWGDGTIVRDYVYIDDITQALVLASDKRFASGIYNVSSGVGSSVNQVLQIVGDVTGTRLQIGYTGSREFDVPKVVLDNAKLRSLGWVPRVSLYEGICKTWDGMVRHNRGSRTA